MLIKMKIIGKESIAEKTKMVNRRNSRKTKLDLHPEKAKRKRKIKRSKREQDLMKNWNHMINLFQMYQLTTSFPHLRNFLEESQG